MVLQIFQKQEEMKAKKQYQKNISNIYDLEDICTVIDELVERMNDVNCEYKYKHIQALNDIKFDIVDEIINYENKNLDIMEDWEEV